MPESFTFDEGNAEAQRRRSVTEFVLSFGDAIDRAFASAIREDEACYAARRRELAELDDVEQGERDREGDSRG